MSVPARFVHVGIHTKGEVPIAKLEKLFATSLDWLRYDPHCWILYSSSELGIWRDHIRKILDSNDHFFLCEFEPTPGTGYAGWMKSDVWEWLKKDR
jgi:hypothetical protein